MLQGAGLLKEKNTQVVLVKFPGTLSASLKHDVFVALSDKRAAQPPAFARTDEAEAGRQSQRLSAVGVNR